MPNLESRLTRLAEAARDDRADPAAQVTILAALTYDRILTAMRVIAAARKRREAAAARASLHDPFLHEVQEADRAIHVAADEEDATFAAWDMLADRDR